MYNRKVIILFGPPGSGKGTVSEYLKEKRVDLKHISLGSVCRKLALEESDLGKEVKLIIDQGNLISIELVNKIIKKVFDDFVSDEESKKTILLLDGYPRNVEQFVSFFSLYQEYKSYFNYYIFLFQINHDILIKRLLSRYICSNVQCDKIFSIENYLDSIICNICSSALYKRADDSPDVVDKRLGMYLFEEGNVLRLLHSKSIFFHTINANNLLQDIYEKINAVLDNSNISLFQKELRHEVNKK